MKKKSQKSIESLTHVDARRRNIPTAEYQSALERAEKVPNAEPLTVNYPRNGNGLDEEKATCGRDLDPQIVWRGKDAQDLSDLVVSAPPIYIQEKIHPKAIIDDLRHRSEAARAAAEPRTAERQSDMFANFNGLPSQAARTEFYRHNISDSGG
ncbi:MAG: hypothetical protein HKP13_00250 [Gammaproteobacteria bacterium]|nr:hypothetical protein [Gammaproteobacteria bacterium]